MAANRLTVIDPAILKHMMEHPARGKRWSVRELADVLGCSPRLLQFYRDGDRRQVDAEIAQGFADAVGVNLRCLFMLPIPGVSTELDDAHEAETDDAA